MTRFLDLLERLCRQATSEQPVRFIQVGAYNGISDESYILDYVVKVPHVGIMVEPNPSVFPALKKNLLPYPRITPWHCAIDWKEGARSFYRVNPLTSIIGGDWPLQLGSFYHDHISRHEAICPNISLFQETLEVPCIPLGTLMIIHNLNEIDLLLIDTEGHDLQVLRMANLATSKPALVRYEHKHLSSYDRELAENELVQEGYEVDHEEYDTFGWMFRDN